MGIVGLAYKVAATSSRALCSLPALDAGQQTQPLGHLWGQLGEGTARAADWEMLPALPPPTAALEAVHAGSGGPHSGPCFTLLSSDRGQADLTQTQEPGLHPTHP